MTYTTTYHSAIERQDRVIYIATHMGFGETVYEQVVAKNDTIRRLTNTGVVIVVSGSDHNRVVTMFIASMKQAKEIAGNRKIPMDLQRVIERNARNKEDEKSNRFRY